MPPTGTGPGGKLVRLERMAGHFEHGLLRDGAELDQDQTEAAYNGVGYGLRRGVRRLGPREPGSAAL